MIRTQNDSAAIRRKRERETRTVSQMVAIYCAGNHPKEKRTEQATCGEPLCSACKALDDYACLRTQRCRRDVLQPLLCPRHARADPPGDALCGATHAEEAPYFRHPASSRQAWRTQGKQHIDVCTSKTVIPVLPQRSIYMAWGMLATQCASHATEAKGTDGLRCAGYARLGHIA